MGRSSEDIVFADGAALAFPTVDGARFAAAEFQPHAGAAAIVLADEDHAALFERNADAPLDVVGGEAEMRFEVDDGLHADMRRARELFNRPFDQSPGGTALSSRDHCSYVRH